METMEFFLLNLSWNKVGHHYILFKLHVATPAFRCGRAVIVYPQATIVHVTSQNPFLHSLLIHSRLPSRLSDLEPVLN